MYEVEKKGHYYQLKNRGRDWSISAYFVSELLAMFRDAYST